MNHPSPLFYFKSKVNVIILSLIIFISSCGQKSEISFKVLKELPVDKAILELENVETDQWVNLNEWYTSAKISNRAKDSETQKVLKYLKNRGTIEQNAFALNTYHRMNSLYYINHGIYDSSLIHAKLAAKYLYQHDSIKSAHTFHNIGLAYHFLNQSDSSIKYWQLGYELAETQKDDRLIAIFAGNLGTSYYNSGNNRTARILFRRAAEATANFGQKNGIIINNIISTMIDDGQIEQALKYWEEHSELLKFDVTKYDGQLFMINRVLLLAIANLNDQSDQILNTLVQNQIFPALLPEYTRVLIESKLRNNEFAYLLDSNVLNVIKTNIPRFALNLKPLLIKHKYQPEVINLIKIIEKFYHSENFKSAKNKQQAAIHHLLGAHYENLNKSLSIFHYQQGMGLANQAEQTQIQLNNRIFEELNRLELITQKIRNTESKVREESMLNKVLFAIISLLVVIILLVYRVLRNNLKLKSAQEKQLLTEKESHKKEHELNRRIVEYSKIIIERNQILRHQLQTATADAPKNIKLKIQEIIKNINDTSINEKENPNIANQIIKGEKQELENIYPGFNTLNTTEQRVLALSHENYRPKDIADVLGVSTQYVRNVKSRIKLKLDSINTEN